MSRLVLQGNPVARLGTYLPSPYIEKIIVNPSSIEVRISLMFDDANSEFFDDYISALQKDLFVYVALLFNQTPISMLRQKTISIFDPLCVKYQIGDGCLTSDAVLIDNPYAGSAREAPFKTAGGTLTPDFTPTVSGQLTTKILTNPLTDLNEKFSPPSISVGSFPGEPPTPDEGVSDPFNYGPISSDSSTSECSYNMIQVPFTEFERSDEIIYSSANRLIAKYTYTEQYVFKDIENFINFVEGIELPIEVVSWTSTIDYDTVSEEITTYFMSYPMSRDYISTELNELLNNDSLAQRLTSDRTYEPLYRDGQIVSSVETVYVSADEVVYEDMPYQSLSLVYYKSDMVDRNILAQTFNSQFFIDPAEIFNYAGEYYNALASLIDTFNKFIDTPKILIKLNQVARAFPNKDQSTTVGGLYKSIMEFILNFDKTVKTGEPLFLRQVANPKIIDKRTGTSETLDSWEELDYSDYDTSTTYDTKYLYDLFYMTRWQTFVETPEVTAEGVVEDSPDYVLNSGYFFFDYEKVARTQTNISKIYNVDLFEKIFSPCLINGFLRFEDIKIIRSYDDLYLAKGDMLTHFNDPAYFEALAAPTPSGLPTEIETPGVSNAKNQRVNNARPDYYQEYDEMSSEGDGPMSNIGGNYDYYSYVSPRSFNLAVQTLARDSKDGEDYRLACIEINDVYDWSYRGSEEIEGEYNVEICLYDYTHELVLKIIDEYYALINSSKAGSLLDYLEGASEECSYNDLQATFNDFFSDGIMAAYENDMENAPWVLAPLLYALHSDLILNTFENNLQDIFDYARKLSVNISPYSGTLEQLELFYAAYENFYNTYYAPGAELRDIVDAMTAQKLCYNNVYKIPTQIYDSYDYEEPEPPADRYVYPMMAHTVNDLEGGSMFPVMTDSLKDWDDWDGESTETIDDDAGSFYGKWTFDELNATIQSTGDFTNGVGGSTIAPGIEITSDKFVNVTEEEFKDFVVGIARFVASWEFYAVGGPGGSGTMISPGLASGADIIKDLLVGSALAQPWVDYADAIDDYSRARRAEYQTWKYAVLGIPYAASGYTQDMRAVLDVLAMILYPNSISSDLTAWSPTTAAGETIEVQSFAWKSIFQDAGII